jgi:hypothetical protein
MSRPETTTPHKLLVPTRRSSSIVLPEDPSQEELAQHWTLSAGDKAEVLRCRGESQQRRFALQLCALRVYGRFLPKAVAAPTAITNHLAQQLDLPLVLFGEVPGRLATETDHFRRIRTYLGWRLFDDEARKRLAQWLAQRSTDGLLPSVLASRSEDVLRAWQIVAPARSTLEELVATVTTHVQDDLYTRIAAGLTPELQQAIDDLLQVPTGERRSTLFRLKEYPPEASSAVILRYIERYQFLNTLEVGTIDLRDMSSSMIHYFGGLAKRYEVHALRRFPEAKRYALTACFLVEVHKTILDHIVALHDQLITKKMRESRNAFEKRYRQLSGQYRRGLAKLIATGKTLLDPDLPPETTLADLLQELDEPILREAVSMCTERHYLEERGEIDALRARYPGLRRYFPDFFALPFQSEPGSDTIITGLDLVRKLDAGKLKNLLAHAPVAFVPGKFRAALRNTDGALDRRTWELGLGPSAIVFARVTSTSLKADATSPFRTCYTAPHAGR